jgi:hypothetical protein
MDNKINKYLNKINIYLNKLDRYLIKSEEFLKKIEDKDDKCIDDLNNKLIHIEPPFINYCQFNCTKKAAYIKNGYYHCWFHASD